MKAIQFHFNPNLKKQEAIFASYCFTPQNKAESVLGKLYLAGELRNIQPENHALIKTLTQIIKKAYYAPPYLEPEDSLKRALVEANDFLSQARPENLSFVILTITQDLLVRMTSVGKLKIIFARNNEMFNLNEGITPSFSSEITFPSIAEGESFTGDKILILNQELFDNFQEQNILQELNEIKKKKELIKNFKEKKEILKDFFGLCLFIFVRKERQKIYIQLPNWKFKKIILSILLLLAILIIGYFLF